VNGVLAEAAGVASGLLLAWLVGEATTISCRSLRLHASYDTGMLIIFPPWFFIQRVWAGFRSLHLYHFFSFCFTYFYLISFVFFMHTI
jgi:hypothetical protein